MMTLLPNEWLRENFPSWKENTAAVGGGNDCSPHPEFSVDCPLHWEFGFEKITRAFCLISRKLSNTNILRGHLIEFSIKKSSRCLSYCWGPDQKLAQLSLGWVGESYVAQQHPFPLFTSSHQCGTSANHVMESFRTTIRQWWKQK